MANKKKAEIQEKKRHTKLSNSEIRQIETSSNRLTKLMEQAQVNATKICKEAELMGCSVIYAGNFSDYKNAKRKITDEHLEYISKVLLKHLKKEGYHYDGYILKEYLSGKEITCETYEEFASVINKSPEYNLDKYKTLFYKHAGIDVTYSDGFYSITDNEGNTVKTGFDEPEYILFFNGKRKHLALNKMEAYYQKIIQYIQNSFDNLKEGDADD